MNVTSGAVLGMRLISISGLDKRRPAPFPAQSGPNLSKRANDGVRHRLPEQLLVICINVEATATAEVRQLRESKDEREEH
jgi:hypothetical protein